MDQIPAIAPNIHPNRNNAIRFMAWGLFKTATCGQNPRLIAGKIVGLQEQPDAPARLVANGIDLRGAIGAGQDKADAARTDRDPAFAPLVDIGGQGKANGGEKGNRRIIIWND